MDPVPIGVVGYGGRGSGVAKGVRETPVTELSGVCDMDPDRLEAAREDGIERVTEEYDELLDDGEIEAIAVMTGSQAHAPLSIAALEAGKHVLCAKPLAETVDQAAEMVELAGETGLVGAVGFQKRFRPDVWTLRDAAGDLTPIHATINHQRGIFKRHFLQPGYSYGYLDDLSHYVDIATWIVDRRPVAASARVSYSNFSPTETIDLVTLRIDYTDERYATLIGSMGGTGMEDFYQVVGEDGNAAIADSGEAVVVHDIALDDEFWEDADGESRSDWSLSGADGTPDRHVDAFADRGQLTSLRTQPATAPGEGGPTRRLLAAFADGIRGGTADGLPTFRDGFDALRIAKATVRSHERGGTVHVADVAPEVNPG